MCGTAPWGGRPACIPHPPAASPFSGLVARKAEPSHLRPSWSRRPSNPVLRHFRAKASPGFGPPASSGPSLLSSLLPKLLAQVHSSSGGRVATVPSAPRKKCPPVVSRSPLAGAPAPCRRCRPAVQAGVSRSALLTLGLLVWRLLEGGLPGGSLWLRVPVPAGPWAGWHSRQEEPRRRPGPASPRGCL